MKKKKELYTRHVKCYLLCTFFKCHIKAARRTVLNAQCSQKYMPLADVVLASFLNLFGWQTSGLASHPCPNNWLWPWSARLACGGAVLASWRRGDRRAGRSGRARTARGEWPSSRWNAVTCRACICAGRTSRTWHSWRDGWTGAAWSSRCTLSSEAGGGRRSLQEVCDSYGMGLALQKPWYFHIWHARRICRWVYCFWGSVLISATSLPAWPRNFTFVARECYMNGRLKYKFDWRLSIGTSIEFKILNILECLYYLLACNSCVR